MDKEKIIHQLEARLLKICPDVITRPTVVGREGATKESEWSRQIVVPGRYSMDEYLKTVFGISNPDWGKLYKQATSGAGQEADRISTLHSSSLLALLCFSNVTKETPLYIDGIEYTKVWFEVKNKVFDRPSNIDIVLEGENSDLLFLESKFTEYLTPASNAFSEKYFNFYRNILPMIDGFPLRMVYPRKYDNQDGMGLECSSNAKLYMDGIKQCFSHLIGLCQGPAEKEKWEDKSGKIRFAEILYEIPGEEFNSYKSLYSKTIGLIKAEMLRKAIEPILELENNYTDRIEVCPQIRTYQDVFKEFKLPENVREYYGL
ncbi:hypothetical protein [Bacteroides caecimuris]|uniref:hypothetical protein n=1 Tax=Bacteroides caecimuris TaxID=1796613 RepID=UPI0026490EAD|nr:hypothetical protein [Bacteroides caecimuris]